MANGSLGCNYSSFAYAILQYGHFNLTVSCVNSIRVDWGKNVRRWLEDE